ncbi:PhzF family phenazine biosynthesis protein [Luteococcus sp. Sow4_B9]|uniref:PhzF family phenazine biosynthesis protein n=1 Tax=Luteococcus sp. Sow4_B9 TaxID=3438792 RepID=UPI003F9D4229
MRHSFFEVDVFSTGPFTGNPVAVVADADCLTTDQMAAIASWTNFSETTFLLSPTQPGADYRVRIMTPDAEFPFAGHPTLGTARAWVELGGQPTGGRIVQECGAGLVEVRVDGETLAFATPPCTRTGPLSDDDLAEAVRVLGIDPADVVDHAWGMNGPPWQMLQLRDADAVRAVRPLPHRPGAHLGIVGLEPGDSATAYEVRGFAETFEDPVTGSLNGAVAQWLRGKGLVPPSYQATQGGQLGRAGRIHLHDDGMQLWVGGRADVRVRGELRS